MAVLAFQSGVDVSDRPGLPHAELLTQLYYAAGLFVLGGLDLGTPVSGPALPKAFLWVSYFLAPLITTSAVVEGALRLVGARAFERVGLRQHLLVVGLGRLGETFVAAYRQLEPNRIVLAVDRDVSRAAVAQIRRQHRVRVVSGDARQLSTFSALEVDKAAGVALLTEDDLLNLELAFRLAEKHPKVPIVAHVSNISMQRAAAQVGQSLGRLHVFNGHRVTAEHLYLNHLKPYFESTRGKDTVILAGFGRFGQTILELLQQQAHTEIGTLLIADRTAARAFRTYRAQVECDSLPEPTTIDGDLSDPETWSSIQRALGEVSDPPVAIIGTDSDNVNLQGALAARRCWPECKSFVRFQNQSVFAERLSEQHRFVVLGVDTMLIHALGEAEQRWFGAGSQGTSR